VLTVADLAELTLSRRGSAASQARQFVLARLVLHRLDQLCDAAALVATELVTNVLVHTESVPTLRILIVADRVRIEVEDTCPVLPAAGILDPTATCGRGLVLLGQLTHQWGVTRVPGAGKAVWCDLVAGLPAATEALNADQLLDLWGDDQDVLPGPARNPDPNGEVPEAAAQPPLRDVRVEHVPTALLNATKSHLDDLVRDFTLVNESAAAQGRADQELVDLAARLSHLAAELVGFRNQVRRQAIDAVQRGGPTLTLHLHLPVSLRTSLIDYQQALDEAEEHSHAGRLLVPAAPAEQTQFRRWKLDRILEQLGDPRPVPRADQSASSGAHQAAPTRGGA
jgi:anti-sigma regulatory factor (Ser/Thr protein kinase)